MAKGPAIRKKLGDLLVEVGIITAEQLQEALEEEKIRGVGWVRHLWD